MGKNAFGLVELDQLAEIHEGRVVGAAGGLLHVVGDDGNAVVVFQLGDQLFDPLSTQRIEELIAELKADYCIAIVTHNMQQAARSSDYTAFMYLGELIEFDETERIFTHPKQKHTEDYITGRFG